MMQPTITYEDRQRGWAELEVVLNDGSRETLRVHAMRLDQMIRLVGAPIEDVLTAVLRKPREFVVKIRPDVQLAIAQMQVSLILGQAQVQSITTEAASLVAKKLEKDDHG